MESMPVAVERETIDGEKVLLGVYSDFPGDEAVLARVSERLIIGFTKDPQDHNIYLWLDVGGIYRPVAALENSVFERGNNRMVWIKICATRQATPKQTTPGPFPSLVEAVEASREIMRKARQKWRDEGEKTERFADLGIWVMPAHPLLSDAVNDEDL